MSAQQESARGMRVTYPSAAREVPAYAALPPGARRGAVVLHEIMGMQPEIERVVDRFAAAGYAAVAPDLFSLGPTVVCLVRAMRAIARGEGPQIDIIRAARTWLCAETGVDESTVGLIGFCMGGGFALAAGQGWGAVSTNYGTVPDTDVMRGLGPVIGCYGGRDRFFRNNGEKLRERLAPLGIEPEVHRFEGVGHCFLTDGHHPIRYRLSPGLGIVPYNPEVAEEAWRRIFAFFDRHLGPRGGEETRSPPQGTVTSRSG